MVRARGERRERISLRVILRESMPGYAVESCRNTYVVAENKETIRASAPKSSNLEVP